MKKWPSKKYPDGEPIPKDIQCGLLNEMRKLERKKK